MSKQLLLDIRLSINIITGGGKGSNKDREMSARHTIQGNAVSIFRCEACMFNCESAISAIPLIHSGYVTSFPLANIEEVLYPGKGGFSLHTWRAGGRVAI